MGQPGAMVYGPRVWVNSLMHQASESWHDAKLQDASLQTNSIIAQVGQMKNEIVVIQQTSKHRMHSAGGADFHGAQRWCSLLSADSPLDKAANVCTILAYTV